MPDPHKQKQDHLYAEVSTWLYRNITSTFEKNNAAAVATTADTIAKQLATMPRPAAISAQIARFESLNRKCNCQQIPWHNFQVFVYKKLQEREASYQQILSDFHTRDWETITTAVNDFARTKG